ncbi:hypothetical protein T492DRAFT_847540 [Pavlovales sp. CCMP2436]|nr:hypothetical protein T492DRAFT_847540 [Pavlovales sp. CCMP2436]
MLPRPRRREPPRSIRARRLPCSRVRPDGQRREEVAPKKPKTKRNKVGLNETAAHTCVRACVRVCVSRLKGERGKSVGAVKPQQQSRLALVPSVSFSAPSFTSPNNTTSTSTLVVRVSGSLHVSPASFGGGGGGADMLRFKKNGKIWSTNVLTSAPPAFVRAAAVLPDRTHATALQKYTMDDHVLGQRE